MAICSLSELGPQRSLFLVEVSSLNLRHKQPSTSTTAKRFGRDRRARRSPGCHSVAKRGTGIDGGEEVQGTRQANNERGVPDECHMTQDIADPQNSRSALPFSHAFDLLPDTPTRPDELQFAQTNPQAQRFALTRPNDLPAATFRSLTLPLAQTTSHSPERTLSCEGSLSLV